MKRTLITLTPGQSSHCDFVPLLLEYLPAERIAHSGLLDGLTQSEIQQRYCAVDNEKELSVMISDGSPLRLSAARVARDLQQRINQLEEEGVEIILLLNCEKLSDLSSRTAILLDPDRIVPPLVKAIVDDHQVGILLPENDLAHRDAGKWKHLTHPPCYAVASPQSSGQDLLIDAAISLQEQGADVVLLDSTGYQRQHRDFLQRLLGIPVLLPNMLVVRLAAELML